MIAIAALFTIELFMTDAPKSRKKKFYNAEVILSTRIWRLTPSILDELVKQLWDLDVTAPMKGRKLQDNHGFIQVQDHNIFWHLVHEPDESSKDGVKRTLNVCLDFEMNPLTPPKR